MLLDFLLLLSQILAEGAGLGGRGFFVKQLGNIGFGLFDRIGIELPSVVIFENGSNAALLLRTESKDGKMMLAAAEIRPLGGVSSFLPTAFSLCHK